MKLFFAALLLALAVAFSVEAANRSPWAAYRANPQRTGVGVSNGPAKCRILWNQTFPGATFGPPIVGGGGTLFLIDSSSGTLYAVHGNNGDVNWKRDFYSPTYPTIGPLQHLYTTDGSVVYALNATTGDIIWQVDTQLNSPLYVTAQGQDSLDVTIFVAGSQVLFAMEGTTGIYKWIRNEGFYSTLALGTLSLDGSTLYVNDYLYYYAVNTTTGDLIYAKYLSYVQGNVGVLDGKRNILYYEASDLDAFNATNKGSSVFTTTYGSVTGYALWGNNIYTGVIGEQLDRLVVLNGTSGKALASMTFVGDVQQAPTIDKSGKIYVSVNSQYVYSISFNPSSSQLTTNWIFSPQDDMGDFNSPVLDAEGDLYVSTDAGQIIAFSTNGTRICVG